MKLNTRRLELIEKNLFFSFYVFLFLIITSLIVLAQNQEKFYIAIINLSGFFFIKGLLGWVFVKAFMYLKGLYYGYFKKEWSYYEEVKQYYLEKNMRYNGSDGNTLSHFEDDRSDIYTDRSYSSLSCNIYNGR